MQSIGERVNVAKWIKSATKIFMNFEFLSYGETCESRINQASMTFFVKPTPVAAQKRRGAGPRQVRQ
jgi:hypothetical protein